MGQVFRSVWILTGPSSLRCFATPIPPVSADRVAIGANEVTALDLAQHLTGQPGACPGRHGLLFCSIVSMVVMHANRRETASAIGTRGCFEFMQHAIGFIISANHFGANRGKPFRCSEFAVVITATLAAHMPSREE